jgi:hypothetical protein
MKPTFVCRLLPLLVLFTSCARIPSKAVLLPGRIEGMSRDGIVMAQENYVLHGRERMITPEAFKPPVEIQIVAKTDLTNLRMNYAGQFIFNWERNPDQLRVNGGPADRIHKSGAGRIPAGEFVAIKWVVTRKKQSIWVNDELRYEHEFALSFCCR